MKCLNAHKHVILLTLIGLAVSGLYAAQDLTSHQPTMDTQGRFWVYRNGPNHPRMPYTPYGWMSDATNLSQLFHVDLECADHPNTASGSSGAAGTSEKESCIQIKLTWGDAEWASLAFISGPDKPAWWGETNRGRYYNLGSLPKKKLVFYARGERGGESIKVQMGVLCTKPYGDSLSKPIVTEEMKLTQDWSRHEVDLKNVPSAELAFVCNGFGVTVDRNSQSGSPAETQFYLDDIYFE